MDKFWLIFKDDKEKHYEIIGKSDDDTELGENVVRLQVAGNPVRCETLSSTYSEEEIAEGYKSIGYSHQEGIYKSYLAKMPPRDEMLVKDENGDKDISQSDRFKSTTSKAERVTSPRHHIDAGFINRRKCFSVFGTTYVNTFKKMKEPGTDPSSVLMNDHYMIDLALTFCLYNKIPTLGELIREPHPKALFCSTENVEGCGISAYKEKRARNRIIFPYETSKEVFLEYHTEHIHASTQKMLLSEGHKMSIVGEIFDFDDEQIIIHPIIMGPPTFDHPQNRDLGFDLTWFGWTHYEVFPEDIDEFSKCGTVEVNPDEWLEYMGKIPEKDVKNFICDLLGDRSIKDWGGEQYDHFTTNIHLNGSRKSAAFLFKGPSAFEEMKPKHLGKNGDQIYRLSQSNADILIVQHCHSIGEAVRETLRAFAVNPANPRHYCLIDGKDTYKIMRSYGFVS